MQTRLRATSSTWGLALVVAHAFLVGACVDSVCDNAEEICGRNSGENDRVSCGDDYECTSQCIVEQRSCDLRSEKLRACIGACVADQQAATPLTVGPGSGDAAP